MLATQEVETLLKVFYLLRWVHGVGDLDILLATRGRRVIVPGDRVWKGLEVVLQEGFRIPANGRNTLVVIVKYLALCGLSFVSLKGRSLITLLYI